MNLKLIKHPDYLLLVDTKLSSPPFNKEDRFHNSSNGKIEFSYVLDEQLNNKIIAASPKLGDLPELPELPKQKEDLEQLAWDKIRERYTNGYVDERIKTGSWPIDWDIQRRFFIEGYKAATKRYSEEDMADFAQWMIKQYSLYRNNDPDWAKRMLPEYKEKMS